LHRRKDNDPQANEVGIASLYFNEGLGHSDFIYARRLLGIIRYRFHEESACDAKPNHITSLLALATKEPLTLGDLVQLIEGIAEPNGPDLLNYSYCLSFRDGFTGDVYAIVWSFLASSTY